MELPKDQEGLFKLAKAQGWRIDRTTGGHWRLESPQKQVVITSGTPSDFRAVKNFRGQLKRAGLFPATVLRTPMAQLMEPKLVVDKNPTVTAAPGLLSPGTPGYIRQVILGAMRQVNRGGGMSAEDLLTHVKVKLPDYTLRKLDSYLQNLKAGGWLTLENTGRYAIVEGGPKVQKRKRPGKKAVGTDYNTDADFLALERALGCLSELEAIIRKHQAIAKTFSGLKGLINQIGGVASEKQGGGTAGGT